LYQCSEFSNALQKVRTSGKIADVHQADADRLVGRPLDAGIVLASRGDGRQAVGGIRPLKLQD
jgi:hypothetical protein